MSCLVVDHSRPCLREKAHDDLVSPGKIRDDETLCRGGYPMHDDKGNPKIGFIRSSDLAKGELSIWRVSSSTAELGEVVEILKGYKPQGQELLWVLGVKARELRDLLPKAPLCAID